MKGKKIFVSGGAGVIGVELVQMLHKKGAILLVGDLKDKPEFFHKDILYRKGDLNEISKEELLRFQPEYFFHLAATFERSAETWGHWEENFWHNIRLSNHLMSLIKEIPTVRRVINCSSYLIYDKSLYQFIDAKEKPIRLKESDPISPRNLTGMAKLAHELELNFLTQFEKTPFSIISARIYRGYGFNSRDVISRWVRDLIEGKAITVYNPEGTFDYMFGTDTAEGLIRLSQTNYSGIVNLGTGKSRRVSEVVSILKASFPNAIFNYVKSNELIESSEADTTLLKNLLGWVPSRRLEQTIPEIIEFEYSNAKNITRAPKLNRVLVTSISNKIPLLQDVRKSLRKLNGAWELIGADMNPDNLGRYFVDHFHISKRFTEDYTNELLKYCEDMDIKFIIPTREGDLSFFNQVREKFTDAGIKIMLTEKAERFYDKLSFYHEFNSSINIIPTFEKIDDLNISSNCLVVKERFGSGSTNLFLKQTKEQAIEICKELKQPIIQPFIEGQEYSVDGYCSEKFKLLGLVIRKRSKVVNGESKVTDVIDSNSNLYKRLEDVISKLNVQYHFVLQFILTPKDEIHILECNARYGGASSISIHLGVDSFKWFIENHESELQIVPTKSITQIRHETNLYL